MASRRLVLPEAFGPLMRVKCGSSSRLAWCKQRKSVTCTRRSVIRSEPHGHDNVPRARAARRADETTAVAVREAELDVLAIDRRQGIQQIIDVESDFEIRALVGNFDLLFGLFLLRVVGLDGHRI